MIYPIFQTFNNNKQPTYLTSKVCQIVCEILSFGMLLLHATYRVYYIIPLPYTNPVLWPHGIEKCSLIHTSESCWQSHPGSFHLLFYECYELGLRSDNIFTYYIAWKQAYLASGNMWKIGDLTLTFFGFEMTTLFPYLFSRTVVRNLFHSKHLLDSRYQC